LASEGEAMAAPGFVATIQADLGAVADRARASLVQIQDGGQGAGSGTIWDDEGLIVTNAHVAHGERVEVRLPGGRRSSAQVLAADPSRDLAVLRVEADGFPGLVPGSSRSLRPGELVIAVGHPWGVEGGTTLGAVIGVGADLPENPAPGRELIALSLQLRPGHSGGPLVDVQGRLVGICAMMAGPEVGLAIPVDVVRDFLRSSLPGSQARAA